MNTCKRCLLYESAQTDVLESIQEHINKIPHNQKANDSLYESRLNFCKCCDHLLSGTCLKCGCYVELRAAFLDARCPDSKDRKW